MKARLDRQAKVQRVTAQRFVGLRGRFVQLQARFFQRQGWPIAEVERWLSPNLGYEP